MSTSRAIEKGRRAGLRAVAAGLALTLAFLVPCAHSEDTAASALIQRFSAGLTSYQADFIQEVVDDQGRMLERSWGQMALATPAQLRWHYLGEFEQLIVADGRQVWNHDVDLEQVTVKDQAQAVDDSPLYLLMAPDQMEALYRVTLADTVSTSAPAGLKRIRLTPREPRADFDWIDLGFSDNQLALLMIQDAFGQQTLIQFSEPVRNPALDETLFQFTPPEGVDVLSAEEFSLEDPQ